MLKPCNRQSTDLEKWVETNLGKIYQWEGELVPFREFNSYDFSTAKVECFWLYDDYCFNIVEYSHGTSFEVILHSTSKSKTGKTLNELQEFLVQDYKTYKAIKLMTATTGRKLSEFDEWVIYNLGEIASYQSDFQCQGTLMLGTSQSTSASHYVLDNKFEFTIGKMYSHKVGELKSTYYLSTTPETFQEFGSLDEIKEVLVKCLEAIKLLELEKLENF